MLASDRHERAAVCTPAEVVHTAAVSPMTVRADGARTHAAGVFRGGPSAAVCFLEGNKVIRDGPQSGPSIRILPSRSITSRRRGPCIHGPATREGRQAVRERAPGTPGISLPRLRANSDLPRKLLLPCAAPCMRDSGQGPVNSDPTRKTIVTSHARSKDELGYLSGQSLVELPNPTRGSPANRVIHAEHRRVGGRPRRGLGQYGPHTRNSDLLRKGIVTPPAGNRDLSRKAIETPRARSLQKSRAKRRIFRS